MNRADFESIAFLLGLWLVIFGADALAAARAWLVKKGWWRA